MRSQAKKLRWKNLKNGQKIKPITAAQAAKNMAKAKQDIKDGKMPGEK